jgi:hypothetical protein
MYGHQGHLAIFDNFSDVTAQAYLLSRLAQVVNRPDLYREVFGWRVYQEAICQHCSSWLSSVYSGEYGNDTFK